MKFQVLRDEGPEFSLRTLVSEREARLVGFQGAWQGFKDDIVCAFQEAYAGADINVDVVYLKDVQPLLEAYLQQYYIISCDPCFRGNRELGISRIFDNKGEKFLAFIPRPGYPDLKTQIEAIRKDPDSKKLPIALVEDDIFSCASVRFIIKICEDAGLCIRKIIVSLAEAGIRSEIQNVEILKEYPKGSIYNISDLRDFLLGGNASGLVVRGENDIPTRAPYCLPFINVSARTGIPAARAERFSQRILWANTKLYSALRRETGIVTMT
jgi:hypothetical protein